MDRKTVGAVSIEQVAHRTGWLTVPLSLNVTELRENLQSEAGKPAIFEFAI